MTLNVGIAVALACALFTQLGFLLKHRGANTVATVEITRPLHSLVSLLRSGWFAVGMLVALGAWVLHVAALALAPLSVVQAVLATGLVMLAVLGDRLFGCSVGRRQWIGVAMTTLGLLTLVITLPAQEGSHAAFAIPALFGFEAAMIAIGGLFIAAPRLGVPDHHHGALLGAAAGVLFGVSDVALKALTGVAADGALAIVTSPWVFVAAFGGILAFLSSARAFQQGEAVPVIACTATAANVTGILGGIVVFGDALGGGIMFAIQIAAFALVAASSLLVPGAHGRPATA